MSIIYRIGIISISLSATIVVYIGQLEVQPLDPLVYFSFIQYRNMVSVKTCSKWPNPIDFVYRRPWWWYGLHGYMSVVGSILTTVSCTDLESSCVIL